MHFHAFNRVIRNSLRKEIAEGSKVVVKKLEENEFIWGKEWVLEVPLGVVELIGFFCVKVSKVLRGELSWEWTRSRAFDGI